MKLPQGLRRVFAADQFGRSVALLSSAAAVNQGLAVALAPVITRIYDPADLGLFGTLWATVTFLSIGATLRLEFGVPIARDERSTAALMLLIGVVAVPVAVVAGLLVAAAIAIDVLSLGQLPIQASWLAGFGVLAIGVANALRFYLIRGQDYGAISRMTVWQGVSRALVTAGAGAAGAGWAGVFAGELAGRASGALNAARTVRRQVSGFGVGPLSIELGATLRANRRCIGLILPSHLLDALATSVLVPLALHLYGAAAAGMLVVVQRIVSAPAALLGNSVADVFHGTVSRHSRDDPGSIPGAFRDTTRKLAMLGAVTLLPIAAVAPWMFGWVLGVEWTETGKMAIAMTPWALSSLIVSPVSRLLTVLRREQWKFYYDGFAAVSMLAGMYGGHRMGLEFAWTLALVSLLQAGANGLFYAILVRAIKRPGTIAPAPDAAPIVS